MYFSPITCDKSWFCDTFCSGKYLDELCKEDSSLDIWTRVTSLRVSPNILAVLACVTELRECFLSQQTVTVDAPLKIGSNRVRFSHGPIQYNSVEHLIVSDAFADELSEFLQRVLPGALSRSIGNIAPPLVMITDAGQDLDDEVSALL